MKMKQSANPLLQFPAHRPRRMRRNDWSRRMMQENSLSANNLIYPVFLLDGKNQSEAVVSMPGVNRLSLDLLLPILIVWHHSNKDYLVRIYSLQ